MRLDSVRGLKDELRNSVVAKLAGGPPAIIPLAISAGPPKNVERTIALGIAQTRKNDYVLAVRIQRQELNDGPHLDAIRSRAKGELDVRYIGVVTKYAAPRPHRSEAVVGGGRTATTYRRVDRPLVIGSSVGHYKITGGTLGCIVKSRSNGAIMMLSNNHVLANENRAAVGDAILQPGHYDGGRLSKDAVAKLARQVRLKTSGANLVDAAVATIDKSIPYDAKTVGALGDLRGILTKSVENGVKVSKVGRTTGQTEGTISAFEVDNLVIDYDIGSLKFDNQVEIAGETTPFSAGGDSGSLIVDSDLMGVALLMAGSDHPGGGGKSVSYANPLRVVLDALKVDLAL